MEFEDVVVKENPGLCRCCLSEGCYKDLGTEYIWMNETEVYAEMLLECFDISISQHMEGPNGPNRLICEVCITRLRDACNFKKQVLECEKKFVDMVGRGEFKPKVVVYQPVMKSEVVTEAPAEEDDVEYLDEVMEFDDADDEPLKRPDDAIPGVSGSQEITVSTLKVKGKRGRPKKTSEKPERKAKVAKLDDKPRSSKTVAKDDYLQCTLEKKPDGRIDLAFAELQSLETVDKKRILITILQRTTAMPFRWFSCKYLCFYCSRDFYDCTELKHHTRTEHEDVKLNNVLRNVLKRSQSRIKFDVCEMTCKLCVKPLIDLNDFLVHSKKTHNLVINEESVRFIDLFKLNDVSDVSCVDCGQSFKFFAPLLQHVHKNHSKSTPAICQYCGKNFVDSYILDSHVKFIHEVPGPCKECGEICPTAYAMRAHLIKVHKDQKFKCPRCPELLASRQQKKRHLELVHNVKRKEFKCEECSKVFNRHAGLVHHKLRVHSQQKTTECDVCGFKVYNMHGLRLHMVKHSDERPFECSYCNKTFQRKRGLDLHVRIHTNDRRYVCKLCDKAFVQTASLKCHVKTHHSTG